jgi:hypothetical protein
MVEKKIRKTWTKKTLSEMGKYVEEKNLKSMWEKTRLNDM